MNKNVTVELQCTPGSLLKAFAGVGTSIVSVNEVSFSCGNKLTLPAHEVGGIDFVLLKGAGKNIAVIKIDLAHEGGGGGDGGGLGIGAIIGISVGGLAVVGIAVFLIFRCRNKKIGGHYDQLNSGK